MFSSSKPYTAVTVQIERLTGEQYEVDDSSGIVDLIEVIRIQATGPREAGRALRKKLQLRALTILDYLIQNAGDRFLREFADEPLLERLRIAATDPVSDPEVRAKCKQLFGQWAATYRDKPGMEGITALYRQLPKRKQPARQAQAKVLRETAPQEEVPMGHSVSISVGEGPSTLLSSPTTTKPKQSKRNSTSSILSSSSKKKDKRSGPKPFNFEKEKPEILQTIASASVASTNLLNALKLVNRETRRVSDDPEVMTQFERCKQLRRQVLRYIQHIETGDLLGSLIHANEELVSALMAFEVLDKSVDYDSDSEEEYQGRSPTRGLNEGFAGLVINPPKPPRPPRPASMPYFPKQSYQTSPFVGNELESASETDEEKEKEKDDDDDDDNPFGDKNAVHTPAVEMAQPTWQEA
ncbi:VHS domain protein [Rasamsonia emersonii CBS 393.64]|uniref:VHS domain protein n=1 Tax=Rasamsonia emersonii (strain ATCC 16479 / CBS 393.64 / IMI 116815) TaxID=1408163 RepID=A0A0F4YTW4_RASE3|nr:VHS domain protein [Rasamsonia emersonii CBS 393.64]KKA21560.1 VHS domain protein [Rasamsonia emersonii CBS 393.64]